MKIMTLILLAPFVGIKLFILSVSLFLYILQSASYSFSVNARVLRSVGNIKAAGLIGSDKSRAFRASFSVSLF